MNEKIKPADPDWLQSDARGRWEQYRRAAGAAVVDDADLAAVLSRCFALSDFLFTSCERFPGMLADLIESRDVIGNDAVSHYTPRLQKFLAPLQATAAAAPGGRIVLPGGSDVPLSRGPDPFAGMFKALQAVLRFYRRREMMRIAIRDLAGWDDLHQTMASLSALADACLHETQALLYGWLAQRFGRPLGADGVPQPLVVLGMGKLGAGELNFSSDVDLIFAYPEEGRSDLDPGGIANSDFFDKLCRSLISAIGATTEDGFVFRVDPRLRPFGESGPLTMSFDRMEAYYQNQGREWERYAMIKARIVAGDQAAGRRLLERLEPFVYRRYLDFGAFESLREMKQRIAAEVRRKGLEENIKLGKGGIREIEFFGQMFQLIRGGVQRPLQQRAILNILNVLVQEGHIPEAVGQTLSDAYIFLRRTENRLQAFADQQVHRLPQQSDPRQRLAAAMDCRDWDEFKTRLAFHREQVHRHFSALLEPGRPEAGQEPQDPFLKQLAGVWHRRLDHLQSRRTLASAGYDSPDQALALLESLHGDRATRLLSGEGRKRLDRLIPLLIAEAGRCPISGQVLNRTLELVKQIQRRTSYLALLTEYPAAVTHLVKLSCASPWIAAFLSQHPVLLDELLDPRSLYLPPHKAELAEELRRRLGSTDAQDLEQQMESLRVFKQANTLRVAASDITGVLPLMKVSDHLSYIAEAVLAEVLELAWHYLTAKHGVPICQPPCAAGGRGFVVLAYGKLGGIELGYGSDLDLVFLHTAANGPTRGGKQPMDSAQFFARLGQRMLHILTAHTAAGILYEADMRLRPSGDSGILVSHVEGFRDYQLKQAWTWEHQALIRARPVAGDPTVMGRFQKIREQALIRPRRGADLRQEVATMRTRLQAQQPVAKNGLFDLKHDRGGIVDIEFLVQYLILRHVRRHPQIIQWTDNVRLLQALAESGAMGQYTAHFLRHCYLIYRATVHRLNLAQQPATVAPERFADLRRMVIRIWKRYLGDR